MKDLYAKLGIDRSAATGEVQAALAARPEMREFSAILLTTEKRAIYDSTHATLKMIGAMRHHLGLDSGHSWFLEKCRDFAPKQPVAKPPTVSAGDARAETPPRANAEPQLLPGAEMQRSARPRWLLPVVVLAGVLILIALLW